MAWRTTQLHPARLCSGLPCAKPVQDYRLHVPSALAHSSPNVLPMSSPATTTRVEKPLVAYQSAKPGFIQIYSDGYGCDPQELTDQILALIQVDNVPAMRDHRPGAAVCPAGQPGSRVPDAARSPIGWMGRSRSSSARRSTPCWITCAWPMPMINPSRRIQSAWLLERRQQALPDALSQCRSTKLISTARFQRLSLRMHTPRWLHYERNSGPERLADRKLAHLGWTSWKCLQVNLQEGISQGR